MKTLIDDKAQGTRLLIVLAVALTCFNFQLRNVEENSIFDWDIHAQLISMFRNIVEKAETLKYLPEALVVFRDTYALFAFFHNEKCKRFGIDKATGMAFASCSFARKSLNLLYQRCK